MFRAHFTVWRRFRLLAPIFFPTQRHLLIATFKVRPCQLLIFQVSINRVLNNRLRARSKYNQANPSLVSTFNLETSPKERCCQFSFQSFRVIHVKVNLRFNGKLVKLISFSWTSYVACFSEGLDYAVLQSKLKPW